MNSVIFGGCRTTSTPTRTVATAAPAPFVAVNVYVVEPLGWTLIEPVVGEMASICGEIDAPVAPVIFHFNVVGWPLAMTSGSASNRTMRGVGAPNTSTSATCGLYGAPFRLIMRMKRPEKLWVGLNPPVIVSTPALPELDPSIRTRVLQRKTPDSPPASA